VKCDHDFSNGSVSVIQILDRRTDDRRLVVAARFLDSRPRPYGRCPAPVLTASVRSKAAPSTNPPGLALSAKAQDGGSAGLGPAALDTGAAPC